MKQITAELPITPYGHYTGLYPVVIPTNTLLTINNSVEGTTLEERVERILNNGEPITDGAPLIYTNRKDGVDPAHNIRTDRWDLALDMTDQITKQALAKREAFHNPKQEPQNPAGPAPTGA